MHRASDYRSVPWKDLVRLGQLEILHELTLSLPWLAASLYLSSRWRIAALACSFMFFLTGLRQVHGAFHYSIGLPRVWTERLMFMLSTLMLGSMHAVQINHLRHHRHCLADDDVEAMSARMPAWKALATGPLFPLRLHRMAIEHATVRQRIWIALELAATVALVSAALALDLPWLRYHVTVMAIGQCLTSFFAVWTVHHDCERHGALARTIRGTVRSVVTYEMFYHLEHHLFPAVPTPHLPALARRLDAAFPDAARQRVF